MPFKYKRSEYSLELCTSFKFVRNVKFDVLVITIKKIERFWPLDADMHYENTCPFGKHILVNSKARLNRDTNNLLLDRDYA